MASLPSTLADLDDSATQHVRANSSQTAGPVQAEPILQIPHSAAEVPSSEPTSTSATEGSVGQMPASNAAVPATNGHEPRSVHLLV